MELEKGVREELVRKRQQYLDTELGVELGNFDVEFLLDFFTRELGFQFYNQGLADALGAFESKMAEFGEVLFELEQSPPGQDVGGRNAG